MPTSKLRLVAWVAMGCSLALAWPCGARAADVEPFSLTATALLELAKAPTRRDEFAVAVQTEEFRYEFDDKHRLTFTTHQIYRIDSPEAVEEYGQIGATWEPYRQKKPDIRARVVTPDGREHAFDIATLSDETVATGDARKFDDLHYLRGPLPAIAPGSVVELLTVVSDVEPKFGEGISFDVTLGSHGSVENTSITVVTPSSSPFHYRTQQLPQAVISEGDRDGVHEFTLRQGPLALEWSKTFVEAAGAAPLWPRFEFSTGKSWEEVAAAYRALVEPAIRPEEVRALLPADLPADPRQRLAKLLEILHERIRYTGVFFGQGDIVPNPPAVTLERRFGDCKDKSVVLASMLRAAGIPAEVALLNSGVGTDVDPDLPGIGNFNHMIVHVPDQNLWIDATAEYLGAGEAPYENSERWALVIGPPDRPLVRTPALQPAGNRSHERRDVTLSDVGPGEVHLEARVNGSAASAFRQIADSDSKEMRENLLEQFRKNFSAKSVSNYQIREDPARGEVTVAFDLHRVEAAVTSLQESGVAMSLAELFSNVPYGLRKEPSVHSDDDEDDDEENAASQSETRTLDWVFEPFDSAMEIKVVPPKGFKVRSLPKSADLQIGPLLLSQSFREEADGSVTSTNRADSVRGHYTADEGREFREAYLKAQSTLVVAVRFDHESWLLARSGKPAAALRRHDELIAAEPKKAMPRVRAASHLLEFGLVDEALAQAERATKLETGNASAFNVLGTVLQYDEVGRRFGGPFDRAASMRALREAIKLDPDNLDMKLNLATTAEHNAAGLRYGKGSDLDLAVENYKFIVAKRPSWQPGPEYLIQALWQQHKYDEIVNTADKADGSEYAASARLAARVMKVGTETALREDASRTNAAGHLARVGAAMVMLWAQRNYDEARALLAVTGVEGLPQEATVFADLLEKVVRSEDLPAPAPTAAGTAESLIRLMFGDSLDKKDLAPWLSEKARSDDDVEILMNELGKGNRYISAGVGRRIAADPAFVRDLVLSSVSVQEADFANGTKRVSVTLGGVQVGAFFLVQEGSGWKLLAMSAYAPPITREAQRLLEEGDLAGARTWLAAMKSEIEAVPNSETGSYKHFLASLPTTDALDDDAAVRLAALALLVVSSADTADADDLQRAAQGLTSPAQQEILEAARFAIAWAKEDAALAQQAADNLERLKPGSVESLRTRTLSYEVADRWEDAEKASRNWIVQRPNDSGARQALVRALNEQGKYADALAALAPEVQSGRADASQLNNYAWQALVAGKVDAAAVKAAENSNNQRQRRDYSTAHTLACVYADQGRVADARRVLLQILEDQPTIDPQSGEIWLIRGLIAEALGKTEAATKSYRHIEKPEYEHADSVYAIGMGRLARLERQPVAQLLNVK